MIKIFSSNEKWDYELLDTGDSEKLERFGKYSFSRPYESAFWKKSNTKEWEKVDGKFLTSQKGDRAGWKINYKDGPLGNSLKDRPFKWGMSYKGIKFWASPTPFRHFGFFPEQASHWDFIEEKIKLAKNLAEFSQVLGSPGPRTPARPFKNSLDSSPRIKFLNLFGYTGVASLFALRAGAEVTHVDASKQSLELAKENQELNAELAEAPMRVIPDDALKFIEREAKRGNKYDCIIMDPPKFGRGPKGEIWKLEEKLPKLLEGIKKILSDKPIFVILTSYAVDSSALSLGYALSDAMRSFSGKVESGELCIIEKSNGRAISLANTAVWTALEK